MFYNNKFLLLSVLVLSIVGSMPYAKASSPGDKWKFNTSVIDDNESDETIEPNIMYNHPINPKRSNIMMNTSFLFKKKHNEEGEHEGVTTSYSNRDVDTFERKENDNIINTTNKNLKHVYKYFDSNSHCFIPKLVIHDPFRWSIAIEEFVRLYNTEMHNNYKINGIKGENMLYERLDTIYYRWRRCSDKNTRAMLQVVQQENFAQDLSKSSCGFALSAYVKAMEQPSILGLIKHSVDINKQRLKSIGNKLNNQPNSHDPDSNNLTNWEKYQLGGAAVGVVGTAILSLGLYFFSSKPAKKDANSVVDDVYDKT